MRHAAAAAARSESGRNDVQIAARPLRTIAWQRGHSVEDALHDGTDLLLGGGAATAVGCGVGGAGQVVQMCLFGLVELQGAGDGVQHAVGDSGEVAAFQVGVVVVADPGQHGYFFAAQSGNPSPAVGGQARLLGVILARRVARNAYLVPAVHPARLRSRTAWWGGLPVHG